MEMNGLVVVREREVLVEDARGEVVYSVEG